MQRAARGARLPPPPAWRGSPGPRRTALKLVESSFTFICWPSSVRVLHTASGSRHPGACLSLVAAIGAPVGGEQLGKGRQPWTEGPGREGELRGCGRCSAAGARPMSSDGHHICDALGAPRPGRRSKLGPPVAAHQEHISGRRAILALGQPHMYLSRVAEGRAPLSGCHRSLPPPTGCLRPAARPAPACSGGGFSVASRISEKKRMQEQVSSHRTGLPDRLLRLFAPRAPLPPYKGPPKRPPKLPYTGVAQVGAAACAGRLRRAGDCVPGCLTAAHLHSCRRVMPLPGVVA